MSFADIKEKLTAQFALISLDFSSFRDNDRVVVPPSHLFEILSYLKTTFSFDMLIDLSAADYLHLQGATHRYGIWYAVLNVENGERFNAPSGAAMSLGLNVVINGWDFWIHEKSGKLLKRLREEYLQRIGRFDESSTQEVLFDE